jgi:hypothetical protein
MLVLRSLGKVAVVSKTVKTFKGLNPYLYLLQISHKGTKKAPQFAGL